MFARRCNACMWMCRAYIPIKHHVMRIISHTKLSTIMTEQNRYFCNFINHKLFYNNTFNAFVFKKKTTWDEWEANSATLLKKKKSPNAKIFTCGVPATVTRKQNHNEAVPTTVHFTINKTRKLYTSAGAYPRRVGRKCL